MKVFYKSTQILSFILTEHVAYLALKDIALTFACSRTLALLESLSTLEAKNYPKIITANAFMYILHIILAIPYQKQTGDTIERMIERTHSIT